MTQISEGPCAGKTTTLARLRTLFENLGWKVCPGPLKLGFCLCCSDFMLQFKTPELHVHIIHSLEKLV